MKKIIFLFLFSIVSAAYGQKPNFYINPAFKNHPFANIKLIAILPIETPISLLSLEMKQLKELQNSKDVEYQNDFYSSMLEREDLSGKIQNTKVTNAILKQNKINLDSLQGLTPKELSKILGVDAVVLGSINRRISGYSKHHSNIIHCVVSLNDKNNAKIWQYNITVAKSQKKSVDKITATVLRKAMNAFPTEAKSRKRGFPKLNLFKRK